MFRCWAVHNLVAHPVMEILHWVDKVWPFGDLEALGDRIHDATLPVDAET